MTRPKKYKTKSDEDVNKVSLVDLEPLWLEEHPTQDVNRVHSRSALGVQT